MKTRTHLALLLAAILPIALAAAPLKNDNNHKHQDRNHPGLGSDSDNDGVFDDHRNPRAPGLDRPSSVPDAGSTLLFLGSGMGALLLLKRRLLSPAQ